MDADEAQPPLREDFWTQEASATLIAAWGRRYLDLNRGNLRQKDWHEVSEEVNAHHGLSKKTHRTDVQCKNRIDTLKKKYKAEKAKIAESGGTVTSSSWPFFSRMDFLIGPNSKKPQSKPNFTVPPSTVSQPSPPSPPMSLPMSYEKPRPTFLSNSLRNYSAMAAAAAAAEDEDEESEDGDEELTDCKAEDFENGDVQPEESWVQGMRKMAAAIENFGKIFEQVEERKKKMILDLEKQRMLFVQDLEAQRMQWFTTTLAQQLKRKRSSSYCHGGYQ